MVLIYCFAASFCSRFMQGPFLLQKYFMWSSKAN